jgi:hypothetical protein
MTKTEYNHQRRLHAHNEYLRQWRLNLTAEDQEANMFLWIRDKYSLRTLYDWEIDHAVDVMIFDALVR